MNPERNPKRKERKPARIPLTKPGLKELERVLGFKIDKNNILSVIETIGPYVGPDYTAKLEEAAAFYRCGDGPFSSWDSFVGMMVVEPDRAINAAKFGADPDGLDLTAEQFSERIISLSSEMAERFPEEFDPVVEKMVALRGAPPNPDVVRGIEESLRLLRPVRKEKGSVPASEDSPDNERNIRTREAAKYLGIQSQNLKKMALKGKIGRLVDGQYVFSKAELEYYKSNPPSRGRVWKNPFA